MLLIYLGYSYTVQYVHIYNGYKKERDPAFCYNMDAPRGYYAQWNKPGRERQMPYDFTYLWNMKQNKIK